MLNDHLYLSFGQETNIIFLLGLTHFSLCLKLLDYQLKLFRPITQSANGINHRKRNKDAGMETVNYDNNRLVLLTYKMLNKSFIHMVRGQGSH